MSKQILINKYFNKLTSEDFFQNDYEAIIGKADAVIKELKEQIAYVKNPENNMDEETIDFIVTEANELIDEINNNYHNKNDVVGLCENPMAGFYILQDKKSLLQDLKEYCDELEDK